MTSNIDYHDQSQLSSSQDYTTELLALGILSIISDLIFSVFSLTGII
jgi:hypothetical protein